MKTDIRSTLNFPNLVDYFLIQYKWTLRSILLSGYHKTPTVKSTGAGEILATLKVSDRTGKNLRDKRYKLLRKPLQLTIVSHLKDPYNALNTQQNAIHRCIFAGFHIII